MANILSSRFSKCLILTIAHLVLASCMSERSAPETVERLCDRSFDIDNSNVHYLTEELETCTRINGAIFIRYTSQLQDLSFLSNVKRVDGGMIISDNSGLTNIDGLQNIEHIEWLELERNPKVRQLRLGKTIVQGDVRIEENKELELISLDSLNAKFIYIIGNLKLERIDVATSIYLISTIRKPDKSVY